MVQLLLFLAVMVFTELVCAVESSGLSVGIFPRRDAQLTRQMFQPLMQRLQKQLHIQVRLDVPPDFQAFWERLSEGRYDLVHLNPYQYLRAHQQFGYRAILKNEEAGRAAIATVIWVRRDSGIRQPADLRGQKIIFGGSKQSMLSYIMAIDLLRSQGLADSDYLMQFALNPLNALVSLYYRQGMAAGTGDTLPHLPATRKVIDPAGIRPLLKGPPVAQLPWAVSASLDEGLLRNIQRLLTGLSHTGEGRRLLHSAGLTGLLPATDADYDPHRKIVARVLGEHY